VVVINPYYWPLSEENLFEHYKSVAQSDTVDTAGHIREMILMIKPERPDFAIFAGFDDHLLNTLSLGGDGAISASGNFLSGFISA
jgi:dihydrodipicolinate synthase/N-acetylneuraminate lyase